MKAKNAAERFVLRSANEGRIADFRKRKQKKIAGKFVSALALGDVANSKNLHPRGVRLFGATITGDVNLTGVATTKLANFTILPPLEFMGCTFLRKSSLNISGADIGGLTISKCKLYSLQADSAHINGELDLSFSKIQQVNIHGISITGNLVAIQLVSDDDFLADSSTISGDTILSESRFAGGLSFANASLDGVLGLQGCTIGRGPSKGEKSPFEYAFMANGLRTRGSTILQKAIVNGGVALAGANIGGQLIFAGATINAGNEKALFAQSITIAEGVYFQGTEFDGEVDLSGGDVGGSFNAPHTLFKNNGNLALSLKSISVKGDVFLNQCVADGSICLSSAEIGGRLSFADSIIRNKNSFALDASGLTTRNNLILRDAYFHGEVSISSGKIGGQLVADGCRIFSPSGNALFAQGVTISESAFLGSSKKFPFLALGTIDFNSSKIGGSLVMDGCWAISPNKGQNFRLDGAEIMGDVRFGLGIIDGASGTNLICPTVLVGTVFASGAVFARDFVLSGCLLFRRSKQMQDCLNLVGSVVGGALKSPGFLAPVYEVDTQLEEKIEMAKFGLESILDKLMEDDGRKLRRLKNRVTKARKAEIEKRYEKFREIIFDGRFGKSRTSYLPDGVFDFRGLRVRLLEDHPLFGWPGPEGLTRLNGFKYEEVSGLQPPSRNKQEPLPSESFRSFPDRIRIIRNRLRAEISKIKKMGIITWAWHEYSLSTYGNHVRRSVDIRSNPNLALWRRRKAWLEHQFYGARHERHNYRPHPYEQLAKVLSEAGHQHDSERIIVAQRRARRKSKAEPLLRRMWDFLYWLLSDYGYSASRISVWIILAIGCGSWAAQVASESGFIVGSEKGETFNAFTFALDTFVPVIDLGVGGSFAISASAGWLGKVAQLIYQISGWVLTSTGVVTFTGIMRRK